MYCTEAIENDFRASGSGKFNFVEDLPQGMLDYAYSIKEFFMRAYIMDRF